MVLFSGNSAGNIDENSTLWFKKPDSCHIFQITSTNISQY